MKLAYMADTIAAGLFDPVIVPGSWDLDRIRDACDLATYGELSPRALDRLVYMVEWRLEYRPRKWVEKCLPAGKVALIRSGRVRDY